MTTSTLEAALRLADLGIPVFPCGKDKKPVTSHGFKDATTDRTSNRDMVVAVPGRHDRRAYRRSIRHRRPRPRQQERQRRLRRRA